MQIFEWRIVEVKLGGGVCYESFYWFFFKNFHEFGIFNEKFSMFSIIREHSRWGLNWWRKFEGKPSTAITLPKLVVFVLEEN